MKEEILTILSQSNHFIGKDITTLSVSDCINELELQLAEDGYGKQFKFHFETVELILVLLHEADSEKEEIIFRKSQYKQFKDRLKEFLTVIRNSTHFLDKDVMKLTPDDFLKQLQFQVCKNDFSKQPKSHFEALKLIIGLHKIAPLNSEKQELLFEVTMFKRLKVDMEDYLFAKILKLLKGVLEVLDKKNKLRLIERYQLSETLVKIYLETYVFVDKTLENLWYLFNQFSKVPSLRLRLAPIFEKAALCNSGILAKSTHFLWSALVNISYGLDVVEYLYSTAPDLFESMKALLEKDDEYRLSKTLIICNFMSLPAVCETYFNQYSAFLLDSLLKSSRGVQIGILNVIWTKSKKPSHIERLFDFLPPILTLLKEALYEKSKINILFMEILRGLLANATNEQRMVIINAELLNCLRLFFDNEYGPYEDELYTILTLVNLVETEDPNLFKLIYESFLEPMVSVISNLSPYLQIKVLKMVRSIIIKYPNALEELLGDEMKFINILRLVNSINDEKDQKIINFLCVQICSVAIQSGTTEQSQELLKIGLFTKISCFFENTTDEGKLDIIDEEELDVIVETLTLIIDRVNVSPFVGEDFYKIFNGLVSARPCSSDLQFKINIALDSMKDFLQDE